MILSPPYGIAMKGEYTMTERILTIKDAEDISKELNGFDEIEKIFYLAGFIDGIGLQKKTLPSEKHEMYWLSKLKEELPQGIEPRVEEGVKEELKKSRAERFSKNTREILSKAIIIK